MAKSEVRRNYNMTDGELAMFTSNLCITLTRDVADLQKFGITTAVIAELKALGDEFENLPIDDFYLGDAKDSTANKLEKMEAVKMFMKEMALRVEMKWGQNSGKYTRLGIVGMNQFTEEKLLINARSAHTLMTELLPELSSQGLTQQMLDDFEAANDAFEAARNTQKEITEERDSTSEIRVIKGNELYKLVSMYCEIGKKIYVKDSPARYNDYIIYQKEAGGLSVPANFFYDFIGKTFWWDVVNHATSYQLERKEGEGYAEIYAGSDTSYQYNPPDGQGFYRVRARNMNGFGPATEDLEQWYFAVLPPASNLVINDSEMNPGQYRLTWDAVPTATEYSVYRSVVNNGQPAGDYSLQGKTADASFVINAESGKRNYFHVNTKNMSQYAAPSEAVWVEV